MLNDMQSVKPDYGEKTKFKSHGNLLILRSKFSGNQVPEFLIFPDVVTARNQVQIAR